MPGNGSPFPDRTHPSFWFSCPSALSSAPASTLRGPAPNAIFSDPYSRGKAFVIPSGQRRLPAPEGREVKGLSQYHTPSQSRTRSPNCSPLAPLPTMLHHHHPGHMGEGWTMGTGETMREEQRGIRKQMEQEKKVEGRGGGQV